MTAFGVTSWAVNRVGWAFGYNTYRNPYVGGTVFVDNSVYDYSQPIVMMPDEATLSGDPTEALAPPEPPVEALSAFDNARQEFFGGDYDAALASTNAALKESPNDAVIHEFRALTLFALGKYQDAAATLYPVLSVGPGWDWTTMIGLYPDVATYTAQLRKLEAYHRENPQDTAALLVLAYQYITDGHDEPAARRLTELVKLAPPDPLAAQLLLGVDPDAEIPAAPKQVEPPQPKSPIAKTDLIGSWSAKRDGRSFAMTLAKNGTYTWKYTEGDQSQEVTGIWDVDDKGVLAMEMNDDGTMLAQVILNGGKLDFYMLGDTQGTPPLQFARD
jgi:tetratricopeptide (TPR) repeat protein